MGSHSGCKHISGILALLLVLIAANALIPSLGNAQKADKRLTVQNVVDLLTGDVSSDEVAAQARKSGISFQVTATVENQIRSAGGTDDLIRVLRPLAPHTAAPPPVTPHVPAASPPVLVIESSPGQCQVYVDDEPMGSTSQQGRLKLTRFAREITACASRSQGTRITKKPSRSRQDNLPPSPSRFSRPRRLRFTPHHRVLRRKRRSP